MSRARDGTPISGAPAAWHPRVAPAPVWTDCLQASPPAASTGVCSADQELDRSEAERGDKDNRQGVIGEAASSEKGKAASSEKPLGSGHRERGVARGAPTPTSVSSARPSDRRSTQSERPLNRKRVARHEYFSWFLISSRFAAVATEKPQPDRCGYTTQRERGYTTQHERGCCHTTEEAEKGCRNKHHADRRRGDSALCSLGDHDWLQHPHHRCDSHDRRSGWVRHFPVLLEFLGRLRRRRISTSAPSSQRWIWRLRRARARHERTVVTCSPAMTPADRRAGRRPDHRPLLRFEADESGRPPRFEGARFCPRGAVERSQVRFRGGAGKGHRGSFAGGDAPLRRAVTRAWGGHPICSGL